MRYRREIDGLRAVAVLPVIFYHAMPDVAHGGFLGVDVFFVISGYLITSIIISEIERGSFSILGFYERRARRILPALLVVMVATIPFAWMWMLPNQITDYARGLIAVPLFGSNFLFWSQSGYFSPATELKPLIHTWSLAVEEQFYLFFPLFLAVTWKLGRKILVPAIAIILIISLAGAQWASFDHPRANFLLAPSRAWELLSGSLCAFWLSRPNPKIYSSVLSALGLILVASSMVMFDGTFHTPGLVTVFPVLGTTLIIIFTGPNTFAGYILSGGIVVRLGTISYSAYLWHQPIFAFARIRSFEPLGLIDYLFLTALSICLAYLTWKFIENPFRFGKSRLSRISRNTVFYGAAAISLGIVSVGALISGQILVPAHFDKFTGESAMFEQMVEERRPFGRAGQCAVWPVVGWRKDWQNCNPFNRLDRTPNVTPVPVAVLGDSHATDLAAGLRLNGFEPLQATGPGCDIDPKNMSHPCRQFFDFVKIEIAATKELSEIWIAHRFSERGFSEQSLRRTLRYWAEAGLHVVFFTPRPEYPNRNELVLKSVLFGKPLDQTINRGLSDMSSRSYLRSVATDFGLTVVNQEAAFCALAKDCGFLDDEGRYLTLDYAHFTNLGAKQFIDTVLSEQLCNRESRAFDPTISNSPLCPK